jgi:hypothetical protein
MRRRSPRQWPLTGKFCDDAERLFMPNTAICASRETVFDD